MPSLPASFDDPAIRASLRRELLAQHDHDHATVVREELLLRAGRQRADLVVVNGELSGFEIKSDRDGLKRLPGQVEAYSAVMDRATLVVGPRRRERARALVPEWWGLIEALPDERGEPQLRVLREAELNPSQQAHALAQLLWRQDLVRLLEQRGGSRGFRAAGCRALWDRTVSLYALDELRAEVRTVLKRNARAEAAQSPA